MHDNIAVNLRVSCDRTQGDRKYMEDEIQIRFWRESEDDDIEFAFFGVFDGHGGAEAARFAKANLLNEITNNKGFWSSDDQQITKAIRDAFITTHKNMWKVVGTWPRTASGYPSTAGTTASVVIIMGNKAYIAHVGDSTVVMGTQEEDTDAYKASVLTVDHKPESPIERERIEASGGAVIAKSGVQRVVWNRAKVSHEGPVRRSTHIDQIPFLAVARSLGDLWSYNFSQDCFVVSPDPDVSVVEFDPKGRHILVLASDGLWNMVGAQDSVNIAASIDERGQRHMCATRPASALVSTAMNRWMSRNIRADNTSVIVVNIESPGSGPRGHLLKQVSTTSVDTVKLGSEVSVCNNVTVTQIPAIRSPAVRQFSRRSSEIPPSPGMEIEVETSQSPFPQKPALVRSPGKGNSSLNGLCVNGVHLSVAASVEKRLSTGSPAHCTNKDNTNRLAVTCLKRRHSMTEKESPSVITTRSRSPRVSGCGVVGSCSVKKVTSGAGTSVQENVKGILRSENGSKTNVVQPKKKLSSVWSKDESLDEHSENNAQTCLMTRSRTASKVSCTARITRRRSKILAGENLVVKSGLKRPFKCKFSVKKVLKRKLSLSDAILPFRVKRSRIDPLRKVRKTLGRRKSITTRR